MLTHEYELFTMQSKETISDMYNRFTTIIKNLKGLGKTYANKEMVKKILNSLPKSWEAKVTAIEESKDPNTFPLDELVGSLLTHEMKIKNGKEPTKKVDMTFKSTTQEEEMVDEEKEMVMFSKRFNKFMKMDKNEIRRSQRRDMDKGKKKAMVATWSDSDYSDDDESIDDEIANLYFMALEEQKVSSNSCNSIPYTFDELQDAFEDLVLEFENMRMKYSKMISKLKIKNEILLKTKNELDNKNNELKLNFESS